MPELPRLQGPAIPPASAAGVQVNAPSNRGQFAMAQAIGTVGDEFQRMNSDLLAKQNRLDVMKAESDYGQAMADAQNELDVNNPAGWLKALKDASESHLGGINESDMAPDSKDALRLRLGGYEGRLMRQVVRDARLAQVEIMSGHFQNRQRAFIANEDFDGAKEDFKQFAQDSDMPQHEIDAGMMDLDDKERALNEEYEILMGNEDYDYSGNRADKQRKRKQAQAVRARKESEDAGLVNQAMALGEITNEAQLERALNAATDMSEATKKQFRKNWNNLQPVDFDERQEYLDWMNEASNRYETGKMSLDDYRREYFKIEAEVQSLGRRDQSDELRKRLQVVHPESIDKARALQYESTMDDLDREVERWAKDWQSKGGFVDPGIDPDDDVTPVDSNISDVKRDRAQRSMKTWLRTPDGQKATPEQRAAKWREIAATADIEEAIGGLPSGDLDLYNQILEGADDIFEGAPELNGSKPILPKNE